MRKISSVIGFAVLVAMPLLPSASAEVGVARTCGGKTATITGNARSNTLQGTAGKDVIWAGGGNDRVQGGGGNDTICGNGGKDVLRGGSGNDRLIGGRGVDTCKGGPGTDKTVGCERGDGGGGGNCDPSYPDFCIPPPPPDLDCGQVNGTNFTVIGNDPHGFDGDNDGIGCET